jgi:putative peptidoglycan lipid II flippase
MSRQAAVRDARGLAQTLNFALRLSFYVALPATAGLVILRVPITRLLFERGQFTAADTLATADALAWYAAGLAAFSGARIAAQAFYAIGEPGIAVRSGIVSVVANIAAAVALMGPLGHSGLAAASSISAYVNLAALAWAARRRFGAIGLRSIAASVARMAIATAVLAAWCGLALWCWPAPASRWLEAAWLAGAIAGGTALYCIASLVLRAEEQATLLRMLPGRSAS